MTAPLRFLHEPEPELDNLTQDGAHELARRLDAYWHDRGHRTVRHWVEPKHLSRSDAQKLWGTARAAIYVVRSNLVRGQPPKWLQAVPTARGAA